MTEVVTSIDIDAPPERVWELAMDPNCLSEWVTIHRRLHGHDDGPPRKGFAMEQTLHLRGVNFKVHWELVGKRVGLILSGGNIDFELFRKWVMADDAVAQKVMMA